MAYDIIGDIHGQAEKLEALLSELGYRNTFGAYRHPDPNRTVIFVGDFIDRGPRQIDTVNIVRKMVDAGTAKAVMGNHELNAISWHTAHPNNLGEYLRPHHGNKGANNRHQHSAFLLEVENHPKIHAEIIDWFLTLPLWLDLPDLRVVHACWHQKIMTLMKPLLTPDFRLTKEAMLVAGLHGTKEFKLVEIITKGLETDLPNGLRYLDGDGTERHSVRIRWWDEQSTTYRDLAIMPKGDDESQLPLLDVPKESHPIYDHSKPLFFGHYWMIGAPQIINSSMACVDYSAARNECPLVAYRWDGEKSLRENKFLAIPEPKQKVKKAPALKRDSTPSM